MADDNRKTIHATKQNPVGYIDQKRSPRKLQHSLRYIEQYAQAIVASQLFPPRQFRTWVVCFRHIAPGTVFVFLLFLMLCVIEEYANRSRSIQDRPLSFYVALILLPIILPSILYIDVLKPMFRWWYGLRFGRYTVARIATIEPRNYRGWAAFGGHWEFVIDNIMHTSPFLVSTFSSGPWVLRLALGSEVHIVVHPTKPQILVAIGIVDEAAPILHPVVAPSLLAELLASTSHTDSA